MKDGIQFTRFYTAAACAPTRASHDRPKFHANRNLSSGFVQRLHMQMNISYLKLKDAGYITGMIGK